MTLSWNEIKDRALRFAQQWADAAKEAADAKPFLVAFFQVFGISSKRVATFEYRVKKLGDTDGYIDLLWKGTLLVEMKSRGQNLDKAYQQAITYSYGLKQHELPKYILVCDFERFRLYDLEEDARAEFLLSDLPQNVERFGYLLGYQKRVYHEQDPANIQAAELMGRLHDRLKEIGYTGHPLELYLVRILFLLFAEDTTIFSKQQFQDFVEQRTNPDGSDLAARLQELFQVLNTPKEQRFKNLDEHLTEFPYVNGKLFEEILPTASFDSAMRQALLECCYMDWSKISPAIFGSMFQSVMNPVERRNLGAHYTSEANILKLIQPLFLDDLWREFDSIKDNRNRLPAFQKKLSKLKFLDPACGCGNFLIITYRELRMLELEVLRMLYPAGQRVTDVENIIALNVDQFYGIEYEEFPARIAEVAMWLIDHQMNMLFSQQFGQYFARLPLNKAAKIVHADALELDWQQLLNPLNSVDVVAKHANIYLVGEPQAPYGTVNVRAESYTIHRGEPTPYNEVRFDYIVGNPPFIGSKLMQPHQRQQLVRLLDHTDGAALLDYVAGWYIKAAQYLQNRDTRAAFVSTNSIVQGEQTSLLWRPLLQRYGLKIHFAHRSFKWSNEARGNAAVYCVIVGFASFDAPHKRIFDYKDPKGEWQEERAKHINPYLVDAKDVFISKRQHPICQVPKMHKGSQPTDGGHLLFTESEKEEFLKNEPRAARFFLRFYGSEEYINNTLRWCLYLKDASPAELSKMPMVLARLHKVKEMRSASPKKTTRDWAAKPTLFTEDRQPSTDFLLIPSVSSEGREYIPIGFMAPTVLVSNLAFVFPNATLYHFGVLTSRMHMAWVKATCGRLESRYRYSNSLVYNNYPWPEQANQKQIMAIETAAQKVLQAREQFAGSTMAELYNPLTMPPALLDAHRQLDKAVDSAYRPQPFGGESNRLEYLFDLYEKYTAELFTVLNKKPKKKSKASKKNEVDEAE